MHGPIRFPVKSIANLRVLILNWWTILEFRILNWNKPFSLCLLYLVLVKCSEFMGGGYVGCVIFLLTLCFHFNNSRFLMKQSPSAQPVLRILMHLCAGYVVSQVTTQWHLCLVFLIYIFFLTKKLMMVDKGSALVFSITAEIVEIFFVTSAPKEELLLQLSRMLLLSGFVTVAW